MICPRAKKQRSYMCGRSMENLVWLSPGQYQYTRESSCIEGGQQRGAWAGGEIGNSSFRLAALWEIKTQGCWSR